MLARTDYSSDKIIADRAERVYQDLYQDEFETKFSGQYVVIEVMTKRAYVAESVAGAIIKAKTDDPNGLFHLIQIEGIAPNVIKSYLKKLLEFAARLAVGKL